MSLISKDHFDMALKSVRRLIDQASKNISQSDWNETDKNSNAYIKNKPFGDDGLEYVFVDLEHAPASGQGAATLSSTCEYKLIPGNIYKVIINGVRKEIECTELSAYPGWKFLMLDPDSKWNDRVIYQTGDISYIYSFTPYEWGITPTSVKVIGRTQPPKRLSEYYIPDTIARSLDVDEAISSERGKIFYGTCATSSSVSAKIATVNGSSFVLRQGAMVCIRFSNTNTVSNITLNVNYTGAKSVNLSNSTSLISSFWEPNSYVTFLYDGVYWRIISMSPEEATTYYYGVTKLSTSTSSTSTSLAATPSAVKQAYDLAKAALPKSGGALTGDLTLKGDPTSNLHAATKQYVDNAVKNVNVSEQMNADWNQNDSTAKDYIKNRPFYDASSRVGLGSRIELYSNTSLTTDAEDNLGRTRTLTEFSLTEGAVYCVNWDGIEYDNITCHKSDNGTLYICSDPDKGADYSIRPFMMFSRGNDYESVELRHNPNDGTDGNVEPFIIWKYEAYEENINIHQLDEKFIPDTIARKTDIQADWNQDESTAIDFIKNKTHYDSKKLLVEQIYTFDDNGDYRESNPSFILEVGVEYEVIFDDVVYQCIGYDVYGNADYGAYIGNGSQSNKPGNGEPFRIVYENYYDGPLLRIHTEGSGSHKIIIFKGKLKQLDEKFIPDTIARKTDIPAADLTDYATKEYVDDAIANIGSDNWEYIGEFTAPEDVDAWEITEDESGVPIRLKKMYFEFSNKPSAEANDYSYLIVGNPALASTMWGANQAFINLSAGLRSTATNFSAHCFNVPAGDTHHMLACYSTSAHSLVWGRGINSNNYANVDYFNGVALKSATPENARIGAGSTVKIWGVRV